MAAREYTVDTVYFVSARKYIAILIEMFTPCYQYSLAFYGVFMSRIMYQ
jgi:hypothetical protein